jgi:formate--tetrahydrofolate ligase
MNERALRDIVIGLGGHREGVPRETGFDITAASEVMAILCLATDIPDLKRRLARIVVAYRPDGSPVTASDMTAVGAMSALLRDAIKPNLVQTTEGVPAFVHGGPFANIAHGTNSIAATRAALATADVAVTEAGFAFELGAEKFFDINCRYGGFAPSGTVLVATVRALKMHGGKPLPRIAEPDVRALEKGIENLEKHVENIRKFEQPCVVAINHFPTDTPEEIEAVRRLCAGYGLEAVLAMPFSEGGAGCVALAELVHAMAARRPGSFRPLYDWSAPIEEKIRTVAREMYGAQAVDYAVRARRDLVQLERLGHGGLPVCIAKTQQSLSDNPSLLGRPKDFLVTVREIQLAAGAGFVIPITGEILRMPGLPKEPLASRFDLSEEGEIVIRP